MEAGLEPVSRGLLTCHVDLEAAVLAQEDHRGLLLTNVATGRVPDGDHVHDLGLGADLDLLRGHLVRLQHHDHGVPGGLKDTGDDARVSRNLAPATQHAWCRVLPNTSIGPQL